MFELAMGCVSALPIGYLDFKAAGWAGPLRTKIGLKEIRALGENQEIWDVSVPGFGARRQRSEAVAYVLLYRNSEGRQRRYTIGRHGALTPDEARKEARRLLGIVATGVDPSEEKKQGRKVTSVAELCDAYLKEAETGRVLTRNRAPKKASTLATDKGRIERHIKPSIGRMSVKAVRREDVERFMHSVAEGATAALANSGRGHMKVTGGRGAASRTLGLLGAIFSYAVHKRLRLDNPVRGVIKFADGRRERRLSNDEYLKLGKALEEAEGGTWPAVLAGARFLLFSGWRRGEMLTLKWSEVDLDRRTVILGDTKTGRSMRPLSEPAAVILSTVPRSGIYVFPGRHPDRHMSGFSNIFARIVTTSGLPTDITPHVLRHSFASLASDLGFSEPTIATLIGHQGRSMTSRYVHSADAVLLAAADAVASHIAGLMESSHLSGAFDDKQAQTEIDGKTGPGNKV